MSSEPNAPRTAVVTGAARGIGLACAKRFAADGYNVVVADKDESAGEAAAALLGEQAAFVRCDVGDRLAAHNLMAETLSRFERIDVLVNNAGVTARADILAISDDDFDRVMRVNLRGALIVGQVAAQRMIAQIDAAQDRLEDARDRYAIINMSSINGTVVIGDQLAYCVSKGGLNQLTRAMAVALAPKGVRVNAVAPGSINTDVLAQVMDHSGARKAMLSRTPMGRVGEPEDVAEVVAFLASPAARYMTGEILTVDGGRSALNTVMPEQT